MRCRQQTTYASLYGHYFSAKIATFEIAQQFVEVVYEVQKCGENPTLVEAAIDVKRF